MSRIAIITGSTRPGRHNEAVAKWVLDHAQRRDDAQFDLVDIADYGLAQLDEMMPASMGAYSQPHTHRWADTIASYDGFIFVTPEYNHSTSGALKNAIDFLYAEWNNKAAGFVSYGAAGGTRAVEHLRLIMAELHQLHRIHPPRPSRRGPHSTVRPSRFVEHRPGRHPDMTSHRCATALGARLMLSADTTKSRKARVVGRTVVMPDHGGAGLWKEWADG
jgi:NAD(P)H-dependent FMN reductase